MNYYLSLNKDDRVKYKLINDILNMVRREAGLPLVKIGKEKTPIGTAIPQGANEKIDKTIINEKYIKCNMKGEENYG